MIEIPKDFVLTDSDTPFCDVERALEEPNGLIAIGGDLTTQRLLDAYSRGIFPWYSEQDPILWYCPNPRMVITPDKLHVSKSLRKTLNSSKFQLKIDTDFEQIIHHCKTVQRKDQTGTWIDQDMVFAYTKLFEQGFVRCIGVYQQSKLVGGLYGVSLGNVFFGESMFSLVKDSSKIAFVHLLEQMGYSLIDCQVESPHLNSLGAFNIERRAFIQSLKELL
ncbi:leucyl/phenylalanyl-tRNA--protein transferase [Candidatus Thioglobus sp.]|nr:leucyl/phenylalanyl-tRNA--protein transferase [Candidatus Thioglobus sp.]MDB3893422.1 leucyl/phenylalanyl-tRNA--protein transferase [Candidatus Thioglobus sp.]MDC0388423.1 leucyl/phenylalanyl-tRNA--protein transferase [Candidatus Thioglobus sp.]MDC0920545.1 leucyl/phenylalanyl-tRNA--protein transferase [Candidatus Thioglobus sp.]MDC0965646.1 leucyl/phenylalanyl-tRNA--protein transferase [Candidatus Thioglobus sp.]